MAEPEIRIPHCHSNRDGDCAWSQCPQIRDGEPFKSERHCPLDAFWTRIWEEFE